MTKQYILDFLQSKKEYLRQNYDVLSIGLFGSYARGDANESSDVDLLIKTNTKSHKNRFLLKDYLQTELNKEIDLGYVDSLRGFIKKEISKDIIYV